MAISLNQFINAIIGQESGGDYSANNGIAVGKYQILKSNVPSWTRKYLGHSMTWQAFLADHAAQDRVAIGQLTSYYNKWGAAGAASAWYSGSPNNVNNTAPQGGGPSIADYVKQVLARASGASNTVSTSSGSGGGGTTTTPSIDPKVLADEYGYSAAFLDSNPELKRLFQKMVSGNWDQSKFTAELHNTQWWKTHSDTEKTYLTKLYTDPAEARQQFAQANTHAQQLLDALGYTKGMNPKQWSGVLGAMAYNIVAKGWTDDQVKQYAGQFIKLTNGQMSGDAESKYSNALQYAYSMGVTMSNSWYQTQVRNIERGLSTEADLQAGIRNQAKAQYSQWSKQIDAGQTIQDLASPYISQMGQILEVDSNALSAFDPTIKKALSYKDPSTGQTGAQPLWQFEQTLRQDPRWLKTQNAQDSIMGVAHKVLQDFGLTGM